LLIFHTYIYKIFDGLISNWQINDDCDKFRLTRGTYRRYFHNGNFYTIKAGAGIFDFQNGNSRWPCHEVRHKQEDIEAPKTAFLFIDTI